MRCTIPGIFYFEVLGSVKLGGSATTGLTDDDVIGFEFGLDWPGLLLSQPSKVKCFSTEMHQARGGLGGNVGVIIVPVSAS